MNPGQKVKLPDAAPYRKGCKGKPRYGRIAEASWVFVGHVLVEKEDREGLWWIRKDLVSEVVK